VPDWNELIRSRLGSLGLDAEREAEIVAELAQHLEETYEENRRQGQADEQAVELALAAVSDWPALRRDIRGACGEVCMNNRTKCIWLPGLVMLTVSMGMLRALISAGFRPLTFFPNWHHPLQFYTPWLLALPILGALGASWSQRGGGGRKARVLAATFPAIALAGFGLVALAADLVVDVWGGRHSVWHTLCGLGSFLLCWVLAPGLALLAGATPFLKSRTESSDLATASRK
jgi:hypothetical protein